jgi:hypothetical protein
MPVEIITKEDLQSFRKQLISDLKEIMEKTQKERVSKAWYRGSEVRKLLTISDGTLQNLRVSGKLPSSKIGGIHYYRVEDIENLLQNNFSE